MCLPEIPTRFPSKMWFLSLRTRRIFTYTSDFMTESLACTANFQSVTKLEGVPFEPDHARAQALTLERL